MKKNLKFYDRDVDSHSHPKFQVLHNHYGKDGFAYEGRFWTLNNLIGAADNCVLDLELLRDKRSVAATLKLTVDKLMSFIDFLLSKECELLKKVEGGYTTQRLQEALARTYKTREGARTRQARKAQKNATDNNNPISQPNEGEHLTRENEHLTRENENSRVNHALKDADKIRVDKNSSIAANAAQVFSDSDALTTSTPQDALRKLLTVTRPTALQPYLDYWNRWAERNQKKTIPLPTPAFQKHIIERAGEPAFDFPAILDGCEQSPWVMTKCVHFGFNWLIKDANNYAKVLNGEFKDVYEKQESKPDKIDPAAARNNQALQKAMTATYGPARQ